MVNLLIELSNWIFNFPRWKKRFILVLTDIFIIMFSFLTGLLLYAENINFIYLPDTYLGVTLCIIISLIIFENRGLYNTFTRHLSVESALIISIGSLSSSLSLIFCIILFDLLIPIPASIIYFLILCLSSTFVRYFIRVLGQDRNKNQRENVAIFGAGLEGKQFMDALRWNSHYRVKFFIDDDIDLQGQILSGIPIESFNNAKLKFKKLQISTLFITLPSDIEATRIRLLKTLSDHPLKIKIIPSLSSLISGAFVITELEDLKIEDLLGREPVLPVPKLMSQNIYNKNVIVTGAGGSIGSELCRQILQWKPKTLILLDVSEFSIYNLQKEILEKNKKTDFKVVPLIGSVQDIDFIKKVMNAFKIDTVYHAAAYKHVPLMEQNVLQCISNNVIGTKNMVEISMMNKVQNFILISTDKAVRPTNFMGASKRFAEIICQIYNKKKSNTHFSIVRFGNVLGSSGSVVPLFKEQIFKGGPITLTHLDITRYFMTIPEAAQLVIQASSMSKKGEIFVLDMGKPIKILELAKKMITLAGLKPVVSKKLPSKNGEVSIIVTGLRPGEKLYEEVSYNSELLKTDHPRIMKAVEPSMKIDDFEILLKEIINAIKTNDVALLFQKISSVTDQVSNISNTEDILTNSCKQKEKKIIENTL